MIVMLLKLVVEEYIGHIGPFDFPLEVVPFIADGERGTGRTGSRSNSTSSTAGTRSCPTASARGDEALEPAGLPQQQPVGPRAGIEDLVTQFSKEHAGRIGLLNTPRFLVDRSQPGPSSVEERTVALMRQARLSSYNDYREAYG